MNCLTGTDYVFQQNTHGSAADHSFAFGYLIGHIDLDNAGGSFSHDFSGPDHNCGFAAAADGAVAIPKGVNSHHCAGLDRRRSGGGKHQCAGLWLGALCQKPEHGIVGIGLIQADAGILSDILPPVAAPQQNKPVFRKKDSGLGLTIHGFREFRRQTLFQLAQYFL